MYLRDTKQIKEMNSTKNAFYILGITDNIHKFSGGIFQIFVPKNGIKNIDSITLDILFQNESKIEDYNLSI